MSSRSVLSVTKLALYVVAFAVAALLCCLPKAAVAQAMAEYGHVSAAGTAAGTRTATVLPSTEKKGFVHVSTPPGEPPEIQNRRALEQSAGLNAANLNVESTPAGASVWVDGKIVGHTPLVLTLAPGKHDLELEGARTEVVRSQIVLGPLEKRQLAVTLRPRYPSQIRLR